MSGRSIETTDSELTTAAWLASRSQGPFPAGSVFLHAPSFAFQAPGGGENQLVQTGRHLEALGVPVRLFSPWTDRLEQARLLHLFGMSREGLELARVARAAGCRWSSRRSAGSSRAALWRLEPPLARQLGRAGRLVDAPRPRPRWPSWRRSCLHLADAILPNSQAEARQLAGSSAPTRADPASCPTASRRRSAGPRRPSSRADRRRRFRALRRPDRAAEERAGADPGGPDARPAAGRHRRRTARATRTTAACRARGRRRGPMAGGRDHDDPLLASAYAAARVFALPSWFETPGLAALEAALAGARWSITPFGCTREYFGDHAVSTPAPNRDRGDRLRRSRGPGERARPPAGGSRRLELLLGPTWPTHGGGL